MPPVRSHVSPQVAQSQALHFRFCKAGKDVGLMLFVVAASELVAEAGDPFDEPVDAVPPRYRCDGLVKFTGVDLHLAAALQLVDEGAEELPLNHGWRSGWG